MRQCVSASVCQCKVNCEANYEMIRTSPIFVGAKSIRILRHSNKTQAEINSSISAQSSCNAAFKLSFAQSMQIFCSVTAFFAIQSLKFQEMIHLWRLRVILEQSQAQNQNNLRLFEAQREVGHGYRKKELTPREK